MTDEQLLRARTQLLDDGMPEFLLRLRLPVLATQEECLNGRNSKDNANVSQSW